MRRYGQSYFAQYAVTILQVAGLAWVACKQRHVCVKFVLSLLTVFSECFVAVFLAKAIESILDEMHVGGTSEAVTTYLLLKAIDGFTMRGGLLSGLNNFLWIDVEQVISEHVSVTVVDRILRKPFAWHRKVDIAVLLSTAQRGICGINDLLYCWCFEVAPTFVNLIIAFFFLSGQFGSAVTFAVMTSASLYLVTLVQVTPWRVRSRERVTQCEALSYARWLDSLTNIRTVKSWCAERHEVDRYRSRLANAMTTERRFMVRVAGLNVGLDLIIGIGFSSAAIVMTSSPLSAGKFALFTMYTSSVMNQLCRLGESLQTVQTCLADVKKLMQLVFNEDGFNREERLATGEADVLDFEEIVFEDVSFAYNADCLDGSCEGERTALKHFSWKINFGEFTGIVGPSGSGKTTILNLLLRLYHVNQGRILIDGKAIDEVSPVSLSRLVAVVPQDCCLFSDTLEYNIRYLSFLATREQVWKAVEDAQLSAFVQGLPNGLNTNVGERGENLSGGQRQRVLIARALLSGSKLLLLDEPTSALDPGAETEFVNMLASLRTTITVIVVTHNLALVKDADSIAVVNDGNIVEEGTHDELSQQLGWSKNLIIEIEYQGHINDILKWADINQLYRLIDRSAPAAVRRTIQPNFIRVQTSTSGNEAANLRTLQMPKSRTAMHQRSFLPYFSRIWSKLENETALVTT